MASSSTVPALNQCELSVSYHDDATIAFCQQHGIVYQSYSPLCGGFNGSSCTMNGGKNVLTIQAVIDIAKVYLSLYNFSLCSNRITCSLSISFPQLNSEKSPHCLSEK